LARPLLPGPLPPQRPNRRSRHRQIIRRRPLLTVVRVRLPNRRRDPMLHPFPPPPVTHRPTPSRNFRTVAHQRSSSMRVLSRRFTSRRFVGMRAVTEGVATVDVVSAFWGYGGSDNFPDSGLGTSVDCSPVWADCSSPPAGSSGACWPA